MIPIKTPKKLIEVALPLDKINVAAAREKSIRHGHPSTLHLWWARRPLAAARAVIFAQMVNDPGYQQGGGFKYGVNKERAAIERERLFKIIEDLVLWENTSNEEVLVQARAEIARSWRETCELNKSHPQAAELFNPEQLPRFHDPFAGGGAIPLEAQRLGLEAYASDLNPVAVTINKAMIEIPPVFAGRAPVGPMPKAINQKTATHDAFEDWSGANGLAEDVRRYGAWMRIEAEKRIGHLYPKVEVTTDMLGERPDLKPLLGEKLTVIAWLWVRTVKSPNPAYADIDVPLASTFILSKKEGKQSYVVPEISEGAFSFKVKVGTPTADSEAGTKAKGRGSSFYCIVSGAVISGDYIKAEGMAGRIGSRLLAVVAEGARGRLYLSPTRQHELLAETAEPTWRPSGNVPAKLTGGTCVPYGFSEWGDLFTKRQLLALNTFSDLLPEVSELCRKDALNAGYADDAIGLEDGGRGATAYSQAICVYLALALDKSAMYWSSQCYWLNQAKNEIVANAFGRQGFAMIWDFAESNPFSDSGGNLDLQVSYLCKAMEESLPASVPSHALQANASIQNISEMKVVSTDPPYYDNIAYADLSDYFYVWLRKSLRQIYPGLFATLAVPKAEELVAVDYRHGSSEEAEKFFLSGMTSAMKNLATLAHPAFPITIYYAFKQSETNLEVGTSSTGWETFLEAVISAGLVITGTWPMRTERPAALKSAVNALASSVILVCSRRVADAPTISRREFLRELNANLPDALLDMTRGGVNSPVAPVDLSQAIIGPGMAIFSQYSAVLEADGKPMSVRSALQLINRFLSEDDFDADTQFCLHWFEGTGWAIGKYGEADVLARAKGTSVGGLTTAGVLESNSGQVRLFKWREYPTDWSPEDDQRKAVWEMLHHLIRALSAEGEALAGALLARMMDKAESIRALAYRLYTLCERKGWAEDARAYNELITSWQSVEAAATEAGPRGTQVSLDI